MQKQWFEFLQVSLIKHLTTAMSLIEEEAQTPQGRYIPLRRIECQVKKVIQALRESRPSHTCPYCNGRGCKVCGLTGLVPKILYDASPEELKNETKNLPSRSNKQNN